MEASLAVFKGRVRLQAEGHIYYVDGRCDLGHVSVSGLVHDYFEEFEGPRMARALVNSEGWAKSRYRVRAESRALAALPGHPPFVDACLTRGRCTLDMLNGAVTMAQIEEAVVEDVVAQWNEARDRGTVMHAELEDFYTGKTCRLYMERVLRDNYIAIGGCEYAQFLRWHDEVFIPRGYKVYATEERLIDDRSRVCGSIDLLVTDREGRVHLRDFKRSRKIRYTAFTKPGEEPKCGKPPFDSLPDTNASHYAVQQNLYVAMIERNTGMRISSMSLLIFHPEHADWEEHEVPWLRKEVEEILAARERHVLANLPRV